MLLISRKSDAAYRVIIWKSFLAYSKFDQCSFYAVVVMKCFCYQWMSSDYLDFSTFDIQNTSLVFANIYLLSKKCNKLDTHI